METINKITDLSYLRDVAGGDNDFLNEMTDTFLIQAPKEIDDLEDHFKEKNWNMLAATAHKMRPSLSFLGLKDAADKACTIEENSNQKVGLEEVQQLISDIKQACTQAIEELHEEKEKSLVEVEKHY